MSADFDVIGFLESEGDELPPSANSKMVLGAIKMSYQQAKENAALLKSMTERIEALESKRDIGRIILSWVPAIISGLVAIAVAVIAAQ